MKRNKLIIAIILLAGILRLFMLSKFPAGLNADEAALGYNAWSLIETGKDEHSVSWPLVFRSFDDYKPPLYVYLALPFVKAMGLSVTSVRLPSALLGTISVYILFLLVKHLFPEKRKSFLPELSAFILAISPWHLQFSRGGWEVNVATFFILMALLFLYKSFENTKHLFVFVISAVLSLYTYHSARVITPALILVFSIIYFKEIKSFFAKSNFKRTILAIIFTVVLALPIAFQMLSKEGQSRFSGVSIFSDPGPAWQSTNFRIEHQNDSLFVKLVHNKFLSYAMRFVQNYQSHFSPDFQFIDGDAIPRSRVPEMGENLLFFLPFFVLGFLYVIKFDTPGKKTILSWLFISPLAAALTYQSPHALRAENMSVPFSVIIAIGLIETCLFVKKYAKKLLPALLTFVILGTVYGFGRYLHMYYIHYPKELPIAWQYGFEQIAVYTKANYEKYDHIIISDRYDQPYILIAFFTKYPPEKLQKEIVMSSPDKYGFSTGRKLDKYEFRAINYEQDKNIPNALIVSADEKVDDTKIINTVKSLSGEVMYKFISTK